MPSILEESLKTDGFHQSKRYIPLNASWACPEDYLLAVKENGEALTGQHELYATAVTDVKTGKVIVKLVNTSGEAQEINLSFKGSKISGKGEIVTLMQSDLIAENSFEAPQNIAPKSEEIPIKGGKSSITLPAYSLNVVKF